MKKAATLATLAALALLGVVLAYWSWAWFAPHAMARAPAAVAVASGTPTAGGLFGSARQGSGAAASSGAIRLLGVMAASGEKRGQAVLRLDAKKTVAVMQGEDVEPGLRLAEVHVDHVILDRNGAREKLAWPEKGSK